ncbi:hypothetical protein BGZ74_003376 [Mortierella antarctica]|nr:hypothetical protein BGZ74_003376 [Mortierella antarctica]
MERHLYSSWGTIDLEAYYQHERFITTEAQQALIRNSGHVRDLHISLNATSQQFIHFAVCTNLWKLRVTVFLPDHQLETFNFIHSSLGVLVRKNPSLTDLNFFSDPPLPKTIVDMIRHVPRLQRLRFESRNNEMTRDILRTLPASIRDISVTIWRDAEQADGPELEAIEFPQFPALKRINFEGEVETDLLLPLLRSCSGKLIRFSSWSIRPFCEESTRDALASLGVFLDALNATDLQNDNLSEDPEIAAIIYLSSLWRIINLRYCKKTGPLTVLAVLHNCEHLEHLNLSGCRGMQTSKFSDMLRRFDVCLNAEDMVGSEWATTSLEVFHCVIVVQRPRQHKFPGRPEHDEDTPELEQSRILQRQVYARLATQTRMQDMRFDREHMREGWHEDHLWNSLEMTLESGLNLLAELKDMRILDVYGTDHRIAVKELLWMSHHWPRLKSIEGLFQGFQYRVPGNEEWIKSNRPQWVDEPYGFHRYNTWWYDDVDEGDGYEYFERGYECEYLEEGLLDEEGEFDEQDDGGEGEYDSGSQEGSIETGM